MDNLNINGTNYSLVEIQDGITLHHSTPFVSIEGKIYVGEASKKEWWQELADLTKEQWTEFTEKEEVQQDEKKDWEIVKIEYNGSIIPLQDGWYVFGEHPQQRFKFGDIPKDVKIHSIKRLSDGETFSIGDYLEDHKHPISQIRIGAYYIGQGFVPGGNDVWISTQFPYTGYFLSVAQKRKENENSINTVEQTNKEWQIISFMWMWATYDLNKEGDNYLRIEGNGPKSISSTNGEFRYKMCDKILSVKRLSDGEVFSIGDAIGSKEGVSISKFIISNNNFIVESGGAVTDYMFGYPSGVSLVHSTEGIGSLKKYIAPRKPILTTADGVTIYEDEKDRIVYGLLTKGSWEKNEGKAGHVVLWSSRNTWLFFSEKYARDEFEINKRPTLSLSDVILFLDAIKWEAQPKDMPALRRLAIGKLNCK